MNLTCRLANHHFGDMRNDPLTHHLYCVLSPAWRVYRRFVSVINIRII